MTTRWHYSAKLTSFTAVIALAIGVTAAAAQQVDVNAIQKRFSEFYAAGNYAAAVEQGLKLEAAFKARFGVNHANYAIALNNLALAYRAQGKFADAERLFRRALAIHEAQGSSQPLIASTLHNLAGVCLLQSKLAEAESMYKRALALREKALGLGHADVAETLTDLASTYRLLGRFAEAVGLYQRALAIRENKLGPSDPAVANTVMNLAIALSAQGKYADAEGLFKRALTIRETALGARHPDVAVSLVSLGELYWAQGRLREAEALLKRALVVREQVLGANHIAIAGTLNGLAIVYQDQGRYAEAEPLYNRALTINEQALGFEHPDVATSLSYIGNLYQVQGRYADAEGLHKRALAIRSKALGEAHIDVATSLNNIANAYHSQGKFEEAENLHKHALAIWEKALGSEHLVVAQSLTNLGNVYYSQAKFAEAEKLQTRALAIRERALGATHTDVAQTLNNLANSLLAQGRFAAAEAHFERGLTILTTALGENHPSVALPLDNMALAKGARGDAIGALAYERKATGALLAHAAQYALGSQQNDSSSGVIGSRRTVFHHHLALLSLAARNASEPAPALGREALEIAQLAGQSSAAAAVQQMAARFATGSDALAALVRELQDLAAARQAADKALIATISKPDEQKDRTSIAAMRERLNSIDGRIAVVAVKLEQQFPDYAVLATAQPLKVDEAQKLLAGDEALVFLFAGEEESYVFAITDSGFEWQTIPLSAAELTNRVARFRSGLDVAEFAQSEKPELFDLAGARELYLALLAPVEGLVKVKRHLLIIPTGPLTALPVHLLLTQEPPATLAGLAAYRDAAWLIRRHAITVLPSIGSLKALRAVARKDQAPLPMIGFADPMFGQEQQSTPDSDKVKRAVRTIAYADFWRGAAVDREKLAKALPRLKDTADEIAAVAQKLHANERDIYLRDRATEAKVKQTRLADYRVVYFATHGLVAGDVKGIGEPALALTLPKTSSELDDGLLTASEVAQLKLNADWVVLSACNTIAGEKPGAEALSGLARAFFYAGARALLISHWAVSSEAATRLTTTTFDILNANPKLGRAEALRQAMLNYMNDETDEKNAYPAFWAPFLLVGEGAAR